ncbi:MAG TPA: TadE/TadG family type IV pilus assembly protein [Thermodesulfobacteriota bacterium]|nr:TadE/TadG family type IV pilus assembly protein [Thermodesulfobacteriota bacterium]
MKKSYWSDMRHSAKKTGRGRKDESGQTTVETVLVIIVLFIMLFGIVEWSRAWWTKNSLNNAVRVGARTAAVTTSITLAPVLQACSPTPGNAIIAKVCASSGVPKTATTLVIISGFDENSSGGPNLDEGDTVTVRVEAVFDGAVPGLSAISFGFVPDALDLVSQASMRYEL